MSADAPDATGGTGGAYQVLARKYRPQTFDDLIGHGPMVRTLRNAFATGRIAHAFVLTGVRGVGKTTTARILARALNYVGPDGEDNGPTVDMPTEGRHCRAIAESRHPDVLEMDAASRTGVNDIRELIEGVRYAPSEARYKVYIIDEVHMLSTAAFNALLKTLEEPPPHVKFIFATTEIRKLPVTVLSRCQRFDLRRIDPDMLAAHLAMIAEKEGVAVAPEGLAMIARAAEGSVRDGLSILDQALIQHDRDKAEPVGADAIRDMLGLADRTRVWDLLEAAFAGKAAEALTLFREQYDAGADPATVLKDSLELVHLLSRTKVAGPEAAAHGPAGEADAGRARDMAGRLPLNALTRAWSLLMKGLGETQVAPDPAAAAEIALIRLIFAADLPTPDDVLRRLMEGAPTSSASGSSAGGGSLGSLSGGSSSGPSGGERRGRAAAAPRLAAEASPETRPAARPVARSAGPRLATFDDVVRLVGEKRDIKLKVELESYVHLIAFEPRRIEMRLADAAPSDLSGRLVQRLKEWTGELWSVTVTPGERGAATLRDVRFAEAMADPVVARIFEKFPEAEIIAIRDGAPTGGVADPDAFDDDFPPDDSEED